MQQWHCNKAHSCGRKCAFVSFVFYLRLAISAVCCLPFHFHRKKGSGVKLKKHDFLATAIWLPLLAIAFTHTQIYMYMSVCWCMQQALMQPCLGVGARTMRLVAALPRFLTAIGHFGRNIMWHESYWRSLVQRRCCWQCFVGCHCYWCCCYCCATATVVVHTKLNCHCTHWNTNNGCGCGGGCGSGAMTKM